MLALNIYEVVIPLFCNACTISCTNISYFVILSPVYTQQRTKLGRHSCFLVVLTAFRSIYPLVLWFTVLTERNTVQFGHILLSGSSTTKKLPANLSCSKMYEQINYLQHDTLCGWYECTNCFSTKSHLFIISHNASRTDTLF